MTASTELWYILPSSDRSEAQRLVTKLCQRLAIPTSEIDSQGYFWLPRRPEEIEALLLELAPERTGKALLRQ